MLFTRLAVAKVMSGGKAVVESATAGFQLNRTLSIYDRFAIARSLRQLLRF